MAPCQLRWFHSGSWRQHAVVSWLSLGLVCPAGQVPVQLGGETVVAQQATALAPVRQTLEDHRRNPFELGRRVGVLKELLDLLVDARASWLTKSPKSAAKIASVNSPRRTSGRGWQLLRIPMDFHLHTRAQVCSAARSRLDENSAVALRRGKALPGNAPDCGALRRSWPRSSPAYCSPRPFPAIARRDGRPLPRAGRAGRGGQPGSGSWAIRP